MELEQRIQWKLSRVKKGIKVKQIAEALSVSSSLISRYEHGQVNMSQKVEKHYLKFIENY